jgi:hypothetical protein
MNNDNPIDNSNNVTSEPDLAPVSDQNPMPVPTSAPIEVPTQPVKNVKKKRIIIGSIIVGALLLIGGGTALAYNLWYQNPEKVVTDALINAFKADTLKLTGSFEAKNNEFSMNVMIDAKAATKNGEVAAKIEFTSGEQSMKLDGAGYYGVDGDLYIKVNNAKDIISAVTGDMTGEATPFDALADKVSGKWIKITDGDIGELSEEYKKSQVCIEDVMKQVGENKALTNEVAKLYKNNRFITIKEKLGSSVVNKVDSLGYVIDVDGNKVKSFAAGLETTEVGKKLKACDDTYDFKAFADSVKTEEKNIAGDGKVQLWASRFGHEITEVNANGTSDDTQIKAVVNPVFNKSLDLKAPADSLSLESLKAEFQAALEAYYTQIYAEAGMQV